VRRRACRAEQRVSAGAPPSHASPPGATLTPPTAAIAEALSAVSFFILPMPGHPVTSASREVS
jgi:hypothetical protein